MVYLYPLSISYWLLLLFLIDQAKLFMYSKSALSKRNESRVKYSNGPIDKSNYPDSVLYLTQHIQNVSIPTAINIRKEKDLASNLPIYLRFCHPFPLNVIKLLVFSSMVMLFVI